MNTKRTPETLSAAQRASSLGIPKTEAPQLSTTTERNQKYAVQARSALNLGLPALKPNAPASPNMNPQLDPDGSFMLLGIHDLEVYSKNPRTGVNPRYEEIKASIRADGISNIISVTRRPGAPKYHPYGGGNTRLQIAKELYEEGDQRFARLNVVVKAWPGDAAVLSAHLAENENRGDISFWEKALGVAQFKREREAEIGKPLTAGELNKELKSRGINFGIKVLQNFAFAIEHLSPVGPWLQARSVNSSIRPCVAALLDIGDNKLDIGKGIAEAFHSILTRYAADLKALESFNESVDANERKPVELNSDALLADIQAAAAAQFGISTDVVPLWISANENDSRIDAAALKAIGVRTGGLPQPPAETGSKPLQPPSTGQNSTPLPQAGRAQGSVQQPLGGMLGLAKPTGQPQPPQQSAAPVAPTVDAAHRVKDLPPQIQADSPLAPVLSLLLEISDLVMLGDVVLCVPQMPFGYLMDMPAQLNQVDGAVVPYPVLRGAAWKFLTSLSYQLDLTWLAKVDPQQSTWVQALAQGAQAFTERYGQVFGARTDDFGNPEMGLGEISAIFGQPELGYLLTRLLRAMEQLRVDHPARFVSPSESI